MNRLREKTTATLLIAIFMISAFALAVSAGSGIQLTTNGNGLAEWTMDKKVYDSYSVRLTLPVFYQNSDEARVEIDYNGALATIDSASFSCLLEISRGIEPFIDFAVDTPLEGDHNAWVVYYPQTGVAENSWYTRTETEAGSVHVEGDRTGLDSTWYAQGQYNAQHDTLAQLKTDTYSGDTKWGDLIVTDVKVMIGEWGGVGGTEGTEKMIVYIDDMTINGNTYALEPDSGVGLSVTTTEYVPQTVSIYVDRTDVGFGSIVEGGSGTGRVVITNDGIDAMVSASLVNEVPEDFYTANLKLDDYAVDAWTNIIDAGTYEAVNLSLDIPLGTEPGPKEATLVFWAEAA